MAEEPSMQQWLIHTHDLIKDISPSLAPKQQIAQFASINHEILNLLPEEERVGVLQYFFPADAAMSLVSGLVKHLVITETMGIPFKETVVTKDPNHGKPCYLPSHSSPAASSCLTAEEAKAKSVAFNVSHQAGLVALIAIPEFAREGKVLEYDVGIDVVCVNERNDLERIMQAPDPRRAWNEFVDMHAEVFNPMEIQALQIPPKQGAARREVDGREGVDGRMQIEKRMRRFFALWCCREAYVKMTGEALLASWLQDLQFQRFSVPEEEEEGKLGEPKGDSLHSEEGFEIYGPGAPGRDRVRDTEMRIVALGSRYMVASAVRRRDGKSAYVQWTEIREVGVQEVVRRARAAI